MKNYQPYLILLFFTLLTFGNTLNHGFVLDDQAIISSHKHVQSGISGISDLLSSNYLHGVQEFNDGLYRPLSPILFAIQHEFWPNSSFPGHFFNLLYAFLTTVVIFILLREAFKSTIPLALALSILFLAFPIHTEIVANIKSSDELLALLFVLSSLLFLNRYVKETGVKDLILGSGLFFIGLFAKESAFAFVGIMPLTLYLLYPEKKKSVFTLGGILASLGGVFLLIRKMVLNAMPNPVDEGSLSALNNSILSTDVFSERLGTALWLQILYIGKAIIPLSLQHDYSFNEIPVVSIFSIQAILGFLFIAVLATAAWKYRTTAPFISIGITWYFGSLLIVSNLLFPIGATFAERFLYAPSFGLILIVLGIVTQAKSLDTTFKNKMLWAPLVVVIFIYIGITINRNTDWESNYTLYTADYPKLQNSARGNYNFGSGCQEQYAITRKVAEKNKLMESAVVAFNRAIEIYPTYWDAYNNLSIAYKTQEKYSEAVSTLNQLVKQNPGYVKGWYNLGVDNFILQDYTNAKLAFLKYTEFNAQNPQAWYFIGMCNGHLGNFDAAITTLNTCISLQSNHIDALVMLGKAYGIKQNFDLSEQYFRKALEVNPSHQEALQNLNMTLELKQRSVSNS